MIQRKSYHLAQRIACEGPILIYKQAILTQKVSLAMPLMPEPKVKKGEKQKEKEQADWGQSTPRRPFVGHFAVMSDFLRLVLEDFGKK